MTPDHGDFTGTRDAGHARWQPAKVTSPHLDRPVPVIAAKDIPYITNANRLQTLSIYLPQTPETTGLIGAPVTSLPGADSPSRLPRYLVHIHGGAWRDPRLTSASIEPAVARAFSGGVLPGEEPVPVSAIASLNYTVSQFDYPAPPFMPDPPVPYDAIKDNHTDLAREAVHPQHVSDVLHGLALLGSLGLASGSYTLSGHSAGACLAFQSILQPPRHYGLGYLPEPPCPAALLGLNGLYEVPALATADGLGASHAHLRDDYEMMLSRAFGTDKDAWPDASPASFDPAGIAGRIHEGNAPRLAVLDQSTEDQLVPMNQKDRLTATLAKVTGLRVAQGHRLTGKHAAPWEEGTMIYQSLLDTLQLLQEDK
jgi:kynurenine formamidase